MGTWEEDLCRRASTVALNRADQVRESNDRREHDYMMVVLLDPRQDEGIFANRFLRNASPGSLWETTHKNGNFVCGALFLEPVLEYLRSFHHDPSKPCWLAEHVLDHYDNHNNPLVLVVTHRVPHAIYEVT